MSTVKSVRAIRSICWRTAWICGLDPCSRLPSRSASVDTATRYPAVRSISATMAPIWPAVETSACQDWSCAARVGRGSSKANVRPPLDTFVTARLGSRSGTTALDPHSRKRTKATPRWSRTTCSKRARVARASPAPSPSTNAPSIAAPRSRAMPTPAPDSRSTPSCMRPPWAGSDHARGVPDTKFDAIVVVTPRSRDCVQVEELAMPQGSPFPSTRPNVSAACPFVLAAQGIQFPQGLEPAGKGDRGVIPRPGVARHERDVAPGDGASQCDAS